jgi:hypothetical protein
LVIFGHSSTEWILVFLDFKINFIFRNASKIGHFDPELFDLTRDVAARHRDPNYAFGTIERHCRGLGIRRSVTLATNRTLLDWRFSSWRSVQQVISIFPIGLFY